MGHGHDPTVPRNFEVRVERREGSLVHASVTLKRTIPPGGLQLEVVYDADEGEIVEVRPYRKLGVFVLDALAAAAH